MSQYNCYPVPLSRTDIDKYYNGFSNNTIWPLSHYFIQYVVHDNSFWEAYKRVNEHFSDIVATITKEGDIIWIHDYQLMLLPQLLREKLPHATIGYFHHIPFPSFEIFRLLPRRTELLKGLLGADLIGFHTNDYALHFLSSVHRLLGYEYTLSQLSTEDRTIRVDTFPMGIDYECFARSYRNPVVKKAISTFRQRLGNYKIILSIDRLDYTKGIPERLKLFDTFFKKNPSFREKVVIILLAVPSRAQVTHYKNLKNKIDELVGMINGKYGSVSWVPIQYFYRSLPFEKLTALYHVADICLVTPLRDGMNLIAKEYIATKTKSKCKGVLVLSEMAGAARELSEALIVNPNNQDEMADALLQALTLSDKEKIKRNTPMQQRIKRYNVTKWAEEFIGRLEDTKIQQQKMNASIMSVQTKLNILNDYRNAARRLFLLDYDGTLISIFNTPEEAEPSSSLIDLLRKLSEIDRNTVAILSGRNKNTLERWFGRLNIGLVAEHGAWLKNDQWELIEPLTDTWKQEIYPILELYMDRTPGSFIEEKEYSLVWHYRKANPEFSTVRARELINELVNLTANLHLQIVEGKKVVEIKNSGINKGRAALRWIEEQSWDFILSIGDDQTDEDMFEVLPETAYSLKVGTTSSLARFNLKSQADVTLLLNEILSTETQNA